jgi:hypothetical protein
MWLSKHQEYTVSNSLGRKIVQDEQSKFEMEWHIGDNTFLQKYYTFGHEIFFESLGDIDYYSFAETNRSGKTGVEDVIKRQIEIEQNSSGADIEIDVLNSEYVFDFIPDKIERGDV